MSESINSWTARLRLASALRLQRAAAGMTQRDLADAAKVSLSKVGRAESAEVRISPTDAYTFGHMIGLAKADVQTWAEWAMLARPRDRAAWWQQYHGTLPENFAAYVHLLEDAAQMTHMAGVRLPPLLHTSEYTEALADAEGHPNPQRLAEAYEIFRQRAGRKLPPVSVILDEAALRRGPKDREAMRRTLAVLREKMAQPGLDLDVIEEAEGFWPGQFDEPFAYFQFTDRDLDPDAVLVLGSESVEVITLPDKVARYRDRIASLRDRTVPGADLLARPTGPPTPYLLASIPPRPSPTVVAGTADVVLDLDVYTGAIAAAMGTDTTRRRGGQPSAQAVWDHVHGADFPGEVVVARQLLPLVSRRLSKAAAEGGLGLSEAETDQAVRRYVTEPPTGTVRVVDVQPSDPSLPRLSAPALLVATALQENASVVTHDPALIRRARGSGAAAREASGLLPGPERQPAAQTPRGPVERPGATRTGRGSARRP